MIEPEIIQGCRRAWPDAQRAFYELTRERIHALLIRMLRDPQDAADVMQDTYLRLFQKFAQFKGEAGAATWAYRVALNEALQFLRKRRRRETFGRELARGRETTAKPVELQIDMQDALDQLPEEERTLLVLKYYEGMNYAEMAELLEKPAGTIASGLNRARAMLRQVLEAGSKAEPRPEEISEFPHLKT